MIRKRLPLSAGEKLQPKSIPHERGDTIEMNETETEDHNNKVTLIGKVAKRHSQTTGRKSLNL